MMKKYILTAALAIGLIGQAEAAAEWTTKGNRTAMTYTLKDKDRYGDGTSLVLRCTSVSGQLKYTDKESPYGISTQEFSNIIVIVDDNPPIVLSKSDSATFAQFAEQLRTGRELSIIGDAITNRYFDIKNPLTNIMACGQK